MNILLISSSAPYGKGESFVISEANTLAQLGENVTLFPALIRNSTPNNFNLHDDIKLLVKPVISIKVLFGFLCFLFKSPKHSISLLKMIVDKNILNTLKNILILPKSIWLSNYVKKNSIDHIHAHWLTTPSTMALIASEISGVPWSVTAHRGDIVTNNILEVKFRNASFVRFISNSGLDLAAKQVKSLPEKNHVIHMGVEVCEISAKKNHIKDTCITRKIVCPANLIPVKGHSYLIESISKMQLKNQIKLYIVGDGELRQSLEAKVRELNLESVVEFLGHIPHHEVLSWYKDGTVDAVILPSLDLGSGVHEGIPVSLMEAMAHRIPVISTRTGGIPELLEDNSNRYGILVTANDSNELSEVLDNLVRDKSSFVELAQVGYSQILANFNQKKSVSTLINTIKNS